MNVEKRIHEGHKEWERASKTGINIPKIFGKYQYIYSSSKGRISLINFERGLYADNWEIFCQEGDLLDDVERFSNKKSAEDRIKELI